MKCNFVKSNNEVCGNNAMNEDEKCFWHSDKISEDEKNEQRSKGGKVRQTWIKTKFDNFELRNINDIIILNEKLINDTLQNKIPFQAMTSTAYNLNLQMRLIQLVTIEQRLTKIEEFVFDPADAEQKIKELFVGK